MLVILSMESSSTIVALNFLRKSSTSAFCAGVNSLPLVAFDMLASIPFSMPSFICFKADLSRFSNCISLSISLTDCSDDRLAGGVAGAGDAAVAGDAVWARTPNANPRTRTKAKVIFINKSGEGRANDGRCQIGKETDSQPQMNTDFHGCASVRQTRLV